MAIKEWCGKPCAECAHPCPLDESIPCSPDCKAWNANGTRKTRLCQESGCDAFLERNLNLTIQLKDDHFEINIYEPESGEVEQISHPYSFDEHPEFDADIGQRIYSWVSLWKDEEGDYNVLPRP